MEVVDVNNQCCVGCLCTRDEFSLQQFTIRCEPLKAIFQVDTILLCYLCKRIAQHAELFTQNVQSNQILLQNFHGDLSSVQSVRSQVQPCLSLEQTMHSAIQLTGTGNEELYTIITSTDQKIKIELKEEGLDHLEWEFIDDDDGDFQESVIKEENSPPDSSLKEEIEPDRLNLKSLRKILKSKSAKKRNGRVEKKLIPINKSPHRKIVLVKKPVSLKDSSNCDYVIMHISEKQCEKEREQMAQDKTYLASVYKCEDCIKGFVLKDSYDRHMQKHSLSSGSFCCKICRQRFDSVKKLRGHNKCHTQRFKCPECNHIRMSHNAIQVHHSLKHANLKLEPAYNCSQCPKAFKLKTSLQKHVIYSHSRRNRVTCGICDKSYVNKNSLQAHLVRKHPSKDAKRNVCTECGMAFVAPSQLRNHAVTHSDHRAYYCVECDRRFKTAASLTHHLKTTTAHINYKELPLPCHHCDRRFAIKRDLQRHINRVHLNIKPYACDKCDRAYINSWSLREHKRYSHDGAKRPLRYPCSMCDKVFDRNSILKSHMRTHTGERPYQCSRCSMKFAQASALGTHVKLVHLKLTRDGRPKASSLK